MTTSKVLAIGLVAVAMTFPAAATSLRAQDSAPSTISKSAEAPPSSPDGSNAAASAINNQPAAPSAGADKSASSIASSIAGQVHQPSDLKALHDPKLQQKLGNVLKKLTPERQRMDKEYASASAVFPSFCKDWEQKLHDRESNNLQHLIWKLENGFETALYTGYSKIESCEAHQSDQGFSIGTITYEEYQYQKKGKTQDEAEHTTATPISDTRTKEIFRFEKGKWFY
jgi:hypothetical protein